MSKILIVEDDEKLSKELKIFLDKNGYDAVILQKFDNAVEDILKENADLILLDINLPYTDGEFICKEIRKTSNVPIIMVTSRDNEMDELISLNYGADQYVTKPLVSNPKSRNPLPEKKEKIFNLRFCVIFIVSLDIFSCFYSSIQWFFRFHWNCPLPSKLNSTVYSIL